MSRVDRTIAEGNHATVNAGDAQFAHSPDRSDHVEDGIHCPDLVQVDALDRRAVDLRFDFGNRGEGFVRLVLHVSRRLGASHDFADLFQVTAVRLRRNLKVDLGTRDFPTRYRTNPNPDAFEAKSVGERAQPVGIKTDAHKGAQGHVAGDAAERVENRDCHGH